MKYHFLIIFFILFTVFSCKNKQINSQQAINNDSIKKSNPIVVEQKNNKLKEFYYLESLPNWIIESDFVKDFEIQKNYTISTQLNPYYFEEDFNGDKIIDFIIPVKQKNSEKEGFAFINGKTKEIKIIGAGNLIKNAISDDFNYIDIWKVNRLKENIGTEVDKNGELIDSKPVILEYPSINIIKSESGGGIIYWNGNEFEYLHQSC